MHLSSITIHPERFPKVDVYPFTLPLLHRSKRINFFSNVVFFAGENGSGKSTLLRAIAKRCGIQIWSEESWARAHYNPYEDQLFGAIDTVWNSGQKPGAFFSAETFDHMARTIDQWASTDPGLLDYFGGTSLLEQSHGESFMSFFKSRYTIEGIYFLDEPETALSPARQLEFLRFLREMGNNGHAQFIVATHSPLLLSCPSAAIFSFDGPEIGRIEYRETAHYRLYKEFFNGQR